MGESGRKANSTGDNLEGTIAHFLDVLNYQYVHPKLFEPGMYLEQPIYTRQKVIGKGIYGNDIKVDLLLYHPEKRKDGLCIECKWQQVEGTVDQKFPYLLINIEQCYKYPTIVIIDGGGTSAGAMAWVKSNIGNNCKGVFSMAEIQKMINNGYLGQINI